jgi:hypothetical protein
MTNFNILVAVPNSSPLIPFSKLREGDAIAKVTSLSKFREGLQGEFIDVFIRIILCDS